MPLTDTTGTVLSPREAAKHMIKSDGILFSRDMYKETLLGLLLEIELLEGKLSSVKRDTIAVLRHFA